ncbi:MAG: 2-oxoglutarate dehydrogenase, E2 component, dihydrolipoamide succinyltransferase [Acidobacteriota bacterium]|nr:2-oxoglutarate dehydrogenase, E2 component, dihydrolipoamide succinyltransferase [Acidobacteriota bacterium]
MATEVAMPQMGESITEGTITRWLKKIGDKVERDEMIFEISTDKVDAEIPSPVAGTLLEIRAQEGETLEVGTIVAIVGEEGEAGASAPVSRLQPAASSQAAASNGGQQTADSEQQAEIPPQIETHEAQPDGAETFIPQAQTAIEVEPAMQDVGAQTTGDVTEVAMPQMGESITEGTITKWLKRVGDKVERDEMIFEISTDKVDAEIPSPVAGTLLEIRAQEGETLEVGTVVALIGAEGAAPAARPAPQAQAAQQTSQAIAPEAPQARAAGAGGDVVNPQQTEVAGRSYDYQRPEAAQESQATPQQVGQAQTSTAPSGGNGGGKPLSEQSVEELRRTRSSPLVRKIAEEHGIDISRVKGTGASGRVTKEDIMNFIASGAALTPDLAMKTARTGATLPLPPQIQTAQQPQQFVAPQTQPQQAPQAKPMQPVQVSAPALGDRVEPMSVMRKKIAQHMTMSKQTSAHVTSVYEIDMTRVVKFRDKHKDEFQQRYGTKLTFMPFIFQAVTQAIRKYPIVNAQVSGEDIIYKGDINLGMAVALDWGLIVPVIKRADTLSLAGLAMTANDLADRARAKKLMPDEVAGGTFTITNPGVFGGLFGTPIINQPQVAILCVGTIEKRPKVITSPEGDDYIAIRWMSYFALTYDHRIVDGADAEKFLSFLKETLENGQFSI